MFIRASGGRKKSEKFVSTEGTISVTTNITGASITVMEGATVVATGSTLEGKTFTTGKIKNGAYVVTVSKEGYKDNTQNVIVNGDDVKVDAPLESVNEVKAELKNAYKVNDTKVQVNFTNKIAVPTKDNFAIAGLTISAAELTEDQKSVILTVSGMELDKTYTVTTKNIIDANGKAVADGTTDFVARKITYMAKMEIVDVKTGASRTELKSDGQDSAKVIVTLTDDAGNVIKDNAEITFTTTAGNFAENKVAVQSGIATNLFTTEISATKKDAYLTATVTSSANKDLLNTTINRTISMNPTINNDKDQSVGVSLTDVMVETCDRVILYFNKDVNATDYTYNDEEHGKYKYNADKMSVKIKDNAKTATSIDDNDGSLIEPIALVPVKGETKALCAILDTDTSNKYLTDNSKLLVKVEDKTKSIHSPETKAAYVTDIRTPSMLNVTNEGLKTIKVTFSEPVQNNNNNAGSYSAEVLSKWVIDNTNLEDDKYGFNKSAKATVGTFNVKTGEDNRNVVTVTLGKNADNKQIYFKAGSHSVQGNNIGDWANVTDTKNNLINTQTLDFVIEADETAPTATVKVESPEQFDVKFNTLVNINDVKTNLELQQYKNGAWVKLDKINVRPVSVKPEDTEASEFIVELNEDWTKVLNTYTSKENYYNYNFRLHLEKEKVVNELNGLKNVELNLDLNDSIMKEPDVTSPKMTGVKQDGNTAVVIDMSEPVQIPGLTGETPSSEQTNGLSTPIVQFISSDNKKTIKGDIKGISEHHNQITVKPAEDMTAGTWKVVVRNISDDVGNTAETLVKNDFVVTGTIVAEAGFKALWVVAVPAAKYTYDPIAKNNNTGTEDIIYVKFNKQIKTYGGAANAGATTNYTVNGYTVPSTSKIDSSVEGYNAVANRKNNYNDLVAIHLPSGTLTGNSHTINISQTIESATGAKLENGGVKLLSENGNIFTWGYANYSKTETKKVSELQALFDDGSYAKYDLTNVTFDANDTSAKSFKLTHTSEVDFASKTIKELTIDTKETGTLHVDNVKAEKIAINAPNAEVYLNGVEVKKTDSTGTNIGIVEVSDILDGTLYLENGTDIENLKVTDSNAGAITLEGTAKITKSFVFDTTGNITLKVGGDSVTIPDTIDVKKACTINVVNDSTKNIALKVDATVKADDINIRVSGTGAANVTATGGVDNKVSAKPAEGEKKVSFSKVTTVNGVDDDGSKPATPAKTEVTVDEVTASKDGSIKVTAGTAENIVVSVKKGATAGSIAASIASTSFTGYKVSVEGTTLTFESDAKGSLARQFDVTVDDSADSFGVSFSGKNQTDGKDATAVPTKGTASFTVTGGNVAGTVKVKVGDTEVSVPVAAYAEASKIAEDIVKAINDSSLKGTYTASNDGATVTVSTNDDGKEATAPTVTVSF
ncbi:MAG: PEGA domain-containing protein [Lachnospiraceae bacterium]|nr:PEGA domain-containing protein [Lachnospiraceae bacterium]